VGLCVGVACFDFSHLFFSIHASNRSLENEYIHEGGLVIFIDTFDKILGP
jgi:hypothetical protein